MKLIVRTLVVTLLGLLPAFSGCSSGDTQTVQPQARGQRGESCQARNDCEPGLACVNFLCVKNEFDITAEAKQCDIVQCATTGDCCGGRPSEAPARCADRAWICATPFIPGCTAVSCTSDAACNGGTCGTGTCSNVFATCTSDAQCENTCNEIIEQCSLTGFFCNAETPCATGGICSSRFCSCTNPDYDPFDPICTDPECVNVCTLVCEDERCVQDTSCADDTECGILTPHCQAGRCVQCVANADCDEVGGESCIGNACRKPCTANEECPLFSACEEGECVSKGCTSDRECVLALFGNAVGGEDSRLAKCLPSDADPTIGSCKVPCENDASCGRLQVCELGYCMFVGCETDEECRAHLGLQNQVTSEVRPYLDKAVCR